MNKTVLTDGTVVYYAVSVNGRVVSQKYTDRFAAEQAKESLPLSLNERKLAEVVVVDASNRQLLLG